MWIHMYTRRIALLGTAVGFATVGLLLPTTSAAAGAGPRVAGPVLVKAAKTPIRLSGPATGALWKRINITCQAPTRLAGGTVTLFQNGDILPQKKKFTVGSGGSCNYWVKSGTAGVNTFDMAVTKGTKTYQSNEVTIVVS